MEVECNKSSLTNLAHLKQDKQLHLYATSLQAPKDH